jgi:hypothetical protein
MGCPSSIAMSVGSERVRMVAAAEVRPRYSSQWSAMVVV